MWQLRELRIDVKIMRFCIDVKNAQIFINESSTRIVYRCEFHSNFVLMRSLRELDIDLKTNKFVYR